MWFKWVLTAWLCVEVLLRIALIDESAGKCTKTGTIIAAIVYGVIVYGIWNWM